MAERRYELDVLAAVRSKTDDLRPSEDMTDAIMKAVVASEAAQQGSDLAQVAARTATLDADDAFTDRVMSEISHRSLEDIARATEDLRPTDAFTDAVVRATWRSRRRPDVWAEGIVRSARVGVAVAAAIAAATVLFSTYAQDELDADVMATVDTLEVTE